MHFEIDYLEGVTIFYDTVSSVEMVAAAVVEIWLYVRTSYGADILPTDRPCNSLDKTIITIIIIVVVIVVTDFSDSEPRLRRLIFRRSKGYGDRLSASRLRNVAKSEAATAAVSSSFSSSSSSSRQFQYVRLRVRLRLSVEKPRSLSYASCV